MAKEFSYKVGVDPDKGIQGLKALQREAEKSLGDVNNELEDGEDNAKALAQAMRDMADRVESRLKETARASDALGKALGPELRASLGQNGIDKMVADMNQAGLTFDQITKDADELADGIKRLSQAGEGIGGRLRPEFENLEGSASKANKEMDKSGSVVANFAGNAAQDLPGVSGAFGALNVAVGQFAEYASEGGIGMKNFLKAAGGLGLATGAFMVLNKVMGDMSKAKEEARRQTQAFADALKEEAEGANDAVNALIAKELADKKIVKSGEAAGLTISDMAAAIKGEATPAFEALRKKVGEYNSNQQLADILSGKVTEAQAKLVHSLDGLAKSYAKGNDVSVETVRIQKELGLEVDKTAGEYKSGTDEVARYQGKMEAATRADEYAKQASEDHAKALDEQAQAAEDAQQASEDLEGAIQDQIDTIRSAEDKSYALRKATDESKDAFKEYTDVIKNRKSTTDERQDALDKAYFAYLDEASAASDAAKAQEELAGGTQTASERARIQIEKLDEVIGRLAPNSPLRKQLEEYKAELQGIPGTVSTEILLNTKKLVQDMQNDFKDTQMAKADAPQVRDLTANIFIQVGDKTVEAITRQIRLKDRQLQ